MRCTFAAAALVVLCGSVAGAAVVSYNNQGQWQVAVQASDTDVLSNVSFASADWNSYFQASANFDSRISQSVNAIGSGGSITAISGYSPLGVAKDALLGQPSQGQWADTISKYGSTQFVFSNAIYGFGGLFNIAGNNGLEFLLPGSTPLSSPAGIYDGFIGFVSDQAFSSITITWGQNGNCVQCFGNSYVLSNFQLASSIVETPEPVFTPVIAALVILGISLAAFRR